MSFKLFLCKIGLHKWIYYKRRVTQKDKIYIRDITLVLECRRCSKCEKIEESVFGQTWEGKVR